MTERRKRKQYPEKKREWEIANREQIKARRAAAYQANKENVSKKHREYNEKNAAKISLNKKKYYAKRREELIERAKEWGKNNIEKKREHNRNWQKNHPEDVRVRCRNRYARKCAAPGKHTAQEIIALAEKQNHRCANPACRASIKRRRHADHIVPLVRGGSNWISNIQLLCPPCNHRKHDKDPLDWARENGMLL